MVGGFRKDWQDVKGLKGLCDGREYEVYLKGKLRQLMWREGIVAVVAQSTR